MNSLKPHAKLDFEKPIAYLAGEHNYTWIHYADGTKAFCSRTIKYLSDTYYPGLIRIHKAYAVSPAYVAKWIFKPWRMNSYVHLNVNQKRVTLEISRRRALAIHNQLK